MELSFNIIISYGLKNNCVFSVILPSKISGHFIRKFMKEILKSECTEISSFFKKKTPQGKVGLQETFDSSVKQCIRIWGSCIMLIIVSYFMCSGHIIVMEWSFHDS